MSRHYIITLQRAAQHTRQSTWHGTYLGDDDESAAFIDVWGTACEKVTEATGLDWTMGNTAVLFYRLTNNEREHVLGATASAFALAPQKPGGPMCVRCSKPMDIFDEEWHQASCGILCTTCYMDWRRSVESGERIAAAIQHRKDRERAESGD